MAYDTRAETSAESCVFTIILRGSERSFGRTYMHESLMIWYTYLVKLNRKRKKNKKCFRLGRCVLRAFERKHVRFECKNNNRIYSSILYVTRMLVIVCALVDKPTAVAYDTKRNTWSRRLSTVRYDDDHRKSIGKSCFHRRVRSTIINHVFRRAMRIRTTDYQFVTCPVKYNIYIYIHIAMHIAII